MRKVTMMVRFNRGGKFLMKRALRAANGRLVPRRAVACTRTLRRRTNTMYATRRRAGGAFTTP